MAIASTILSFAKPVQVISEFIGATGGSVGASTGGTEGGIAITSSGALSAEPEEDLQPINSI